MHVHHYVKRYVSQAGWNQWRSLSYKYALQKSEAFKKKKYKKIVTTDVFFFCQRQFLASLFRDYYVYFLFSLKKFFSLSFSSSHHLSPEPYTDLFFNLLSSCPSPCLLHQLIFLINPQLILVCTMLWQGWRMFSILSSGKYDSYLVSAHALLFVKRQALKPKFYLPSISFFTITSLPLFVANFR